MKATQCERILRHLRDFGSINPIEAISEYGCMRLASRISDLKRQGYNISAERGKGENRYGETTTFAVYRLVEEVGK